MLGPAGRSSVGDGSVSKDIVVGIGEKDIGPQE